MTWNEKGVAAVLAAALMMAGGAVSAEQMPDMDPIEEIDGADAAETAIEDAEDEAEEDLDDLDDDLAGEDDDDDKPWTIGGSARMSVGQGTFAQVSNDTQWAGEVDDGSGAFNRVSMNFGLNTSYRWEDFSFSGSTSVSQGLTAGGSPIANAPYETRMGNIRLGAGWSGYEFEDLGISVRPSISASLPSSATSRAQTLILGTSASVGLSKTFFNNLTLSYSLGGSRSFFRYTSPVLQTERVGEENVLIRMDGAEAVEPGRFAIGRVNTPWGMSNNLSASFRLGRVGANVSYTYTRRWSYAWTEEDDFTSDIQCVGRCVGDGMSGAIGLSYRLNDTRSLSGGLNTGGTPKTADQQSFNFPFWNFNGASANRSSIALGLSGSY